MLVMFQPWFVFVYVLLCVALIIWNVYTDYTIEFWKETTLKTKIGNCIGSTLLNFLMVGGMGTIVFAMLFLMANCIKTSNRVTNTSTYTNKSILELTPVKSVNETDYYLTKDFENYTYTFAISDPETGKTIEHEIDFDHTIIIPFQDCKVPSVIYTHNDHEYAEYFDGNILLKSGEGHYKRNNSDNYNDLLIFLIPMNSVMEFKTETRWV